MFPKYFNFIFKSLSSLVFLFLGFFFNLLNLGIDNSYLWCWKWLYDTRGFSREFFRFDLLFSIWSDFSLSCLLFKSRDFTCFWSRVRLCSLFFHPFISSYIVLRTSVRHPQETSTRSSCCRISNFFCDYQEYSCPSIEWTRILQLDWKIVREDPWSPKCPSALCLLPEYTLRFVVSVSEMSHVISSGARLRFIFFGRTKIVSRGRTRRSMSIFF